VYTRCPQCQTVFRITAAQLKAKAILGGVRGAPPVDRKAIIDLMLHVSGVCLAHPEIVELDLNPILAYSDGYALVDARMILG